MVIFTLYLFHDLSLPGAFGRRERRIKDYCRTIPCVYVNSYWFGSHFQWHHSRFESSKQDILLPMLYAVSRIKLLRRTAVHQPNSPNCIYLDIWIFGWNCASICYSGPERDFRTGLSKRSICLAVNSGCGCSSFRASICW